MGTMVNNNNNAPVRNRFRSVACVSASGSPVVVAASSAQTDDTSVPLGFKYTGSDLQEGPYPIRHPPSPLHPKSTLSGYSYSAIILM